MQVEQVKINVISVRLCIYTISKILNNYNKHYNFIHHTKVFYFQCLLVNILIISVILFIKVG